MDSAQQRSRVGIGGGLQTLGLESREQKVVDP
jgi:hypothetical protein